MDFIEANNIAKKVNRYNELSSLHSRVANDIEQLTSTRNIDKYANIIISTSSLELSYTLSNCSVVSFLRKIMRETEEQMNALYADIKKW